MNATRNMLARYGLKWNPFSPEIPTEACLVTPPIEHFGWRVENLAREGGFALITGDPGSGKSVAMRIVVARLASQRDTVVGILTRPQSSLNDFYRELGDLFGVQLSPHNRWAGAKVLRERWQRHIEAELFRAILVVDEAQEMHSMVLNELRFLSSADLDSRSLLTVVLCGDDRLPKKFQTPELVALGTRIRVRLALGHASPEELVGYLRHVTGEAGNAQLMTPQLMTALGEHAAGNVRILMSMAGELLDTAVQRELDQLDEKLYFEVFSPPTSPRKSRKAGGRVR
jgi:general secretion pathway protein A